MERDNWINAGPGVPGVDPEVALDRLRFAKDHFAQCVRKYEMAHNGEELFALPFSEYPELAQTEKDIKLFDQLSDLGVLKCRGAFTLLLGLVSISRFHESGLFVEFESLEDEVAPRYIDSARTASKSTKRPPTAIIPGNESPRWREGLPHRETRYITHRFSLYTDVKENMNEWNLLQFAARRAWRT